MVKALHLLQTILTFMSVISVMVFIHEYGHYFFARLFDVKVESFSIGFGKEILGFSDKNGTRWKLCIIPAGGYVKMFGDDILSPDVDNNEKHSSESYCSKPLYQKSLIALGGPLANFLSAILIIFFMYFFSGKVVVEPLVSEVVSQSIAHKSGILAGDRIKALDGESIKDFSELQRMISINSGKEVVITLERDGELMDLYLTPVVKDTGDGLGNEVKVGYLGIISDHISHKNLGFQDSLISSINESFSIISSTASVLGQIIVGKRGIKEIGGPIRIAQYSSRSFDQGYLAFLWLIASLSVNLAFINLMPIPILDGGHILHNLIEKLLGRSLALKIYYYSFKGGMIVIMSLFAIITFNDLTSIFKR